MDKNQDHSRTLFQAFVGDGTFLLIFTGLILLLSGVLIIFQSISGYLLPHDVAFIEMETSVLKQYNGGSIVDFMFHDRISFGGSIMAVGLLYMWLGEFPLKSGKSWAWYIFVFSGTVGFGSFLTYLGYGYLDTWHGIASMMLIPFYVLGLIKSHGLVKGSLKWGSLLRNSFKVNLKSKYGVGMALLSFSALGFFVGGVVIMMVGMTTVFVPQDLAFMEITVCGLADISPKLEPLIAHDRAAFGGGLASIGIIYFFILRKAEPSVNLWQILALSMGVGFSSAIGVHFIVGYTDFVHLLPAYAGALISMVGLGMTYSTMNKTDSQQSSL